MRTADDRCYRYKKELEKAEVKIRDMCKEVEQVKGLLSGRDSEILRL